MHAFNVALVACEEALDRPGADPKLWSFKGHLLLRMGQHARALECFDIALARGLYGSGDVAFSKGVCLLGLGRAEEARASFERAFEIRPDPTTIAMIAECFHRLGRNAEAAQMRLSAAVQDPDGDALARADRWIQAA